MDAEAFLAAMQQDPALLEGVLKLTALKGQQGEQP
jgi:hypothetical protein